MILTARAPGSCVHCPLPVKPGEELWWEEGWTYVEHLVCSAEGVRILADRARRIERSHAVCLDKKWGGLEFPCPEGLAYYPFQKAGIEFVLDCFRRGIGCLLGDEQGTGKSIMTAGVLNALRADEVQKVLVVCPASLKINWRRELEKWLVKRPVPLRITITNYDVIRKLPESESWDLGVLDEAHYVKNLTSRRGKFAQYIMSRCTRKLALTGTPIPNRVIEIWPLLRMLDPKTWNPGVGSGRAFAMRYCGPKLTKYGMTYEGGENLEELQGRLRGSLLLRRLKRDVLKELPPVTWKILALLGEGLEGVIHAEREAFKASGFSEEMTVEEMRKAKIPFEELSKARREMAVAKIPLLLEHVKLVLESVEKVAVYAHHKDVMSKLSDELVTFQPAVIRGESTSEMRDAAVRRFQTDPECRVFLGSITAAGTGLTLTAASHCVLAEPSWAPNDLAQVAARFDRIGQASPVLIEVLVVDKSIDANMMKKVVAKVKTMRGALD